MKNEILKIGNRAKLASKEKINNIKKNKVLLDFANLIEKNKKKIIKQNYKDIRLARKNNLKENLIKRLELNEKKDHIEFDTADRFFSWGNKIFDKKILLSKSAKSDYLLFFINQIIMSVISPVLITQLAIATALFYYFHSVSWLDAGVWNNTPLAVIISAFTLFHFLLEDFSKYFVHRLMHKWPILWAIHKVHHSATFLTPMTVFRTHPLEGVVFSLRSAFTQAISISSFVFLFGPQVDIATILGANIFIFAFNIAGSNLRHSHIDIAIGNGQNT